ncbi:MAG: hypothetical protein R3F02_02620 [Thiolinea sp.]
MAAVLAVLFVPLSWLGGLVQVPELKVVVPDIEQQVLREPHESVSPAAYIPDIPDIDGGIGIPFSQWRDAEPADMPTPDFLSFRTDPDTANKVWRLGGDGREMGGAVNYPPGNEALGIVHGQHFYSKVSPVNRDETYILGAGGQNQPYAALWELATHRLVAWVPAAAREAHVEQRQLMWDMQLPNVYWYTQGNQLMRATINFSSYQVQTEVWDQFPDYEYITLGYGEGNFSDDGQRIVITGKSATDPYIYFTPYEVAQRRKHPRRQVTSAEQPEFDWAGVDPTGQYILFNRILPERQTLVVSFNQAATAEPRVVYEHMKHSDFVIDRQGEVWIVYGNWQGLFASRLADGFDKRVWPAGEGISDDDKVSASGHVARVKGIPGQVLVSRNYDGGLYFMNIDQPGYSRYLGNSRHGRSPEGLTREQIRQRGVDEQGEVTFYKREPRGAVSASGRYVFFTSDYQSYLKNGQGYDPEPEWCRAYLNMIEL